MEMTVRFAYSGRPAGKIHLEEFPNSGDHIDFKGRECCVQNVEIESIGGVTHATVTVIELP